MNLFNLKKSVFFTLMIVGRSEETKSSPEFPRQLYDEAEKPECQIDSDCPEGQYCYVIPVSISNQCSPCIDCHLNNRKESAWTKCPHLPTQCGECLPGYSAEILFGGNQQDSCLPQGRGPLKKVDLPLQPLAPKIILVLIILLMVAIRFLSGALIYKLMNRFTCFGNVVEEERKTQQPIPVVPTAPPIALCVDQLAGMNFETKTEKAPASSLEHCDNLIEENLVKANCFRQPNYRNLNHMEPNNRNPHPNSVIATVSETVEDSDIRNFDISPLQNNISPNVSTCKTSIGSGPRSKFFSQNSEDTQQIRHDNPIIINISNNNTNRNLNSNLITHTDAIFDNTNMSVDLHEV